jgi:D-alanyl-D-alanine dipeptidase
VSRALLTAAASALVLAAVAATAGGADRAQLRDRGLVSARSFAADIRLDVRYATRRNFTRRRLPSYCRPWALLRRPVALDLARVQRDLRRRGLGLKVYDGYRPARASRAMVRWARRTGRGHLVRNGYIARRSRHNAGIAVDLTLVRLESGRELDMGTPYDSFSRRSHTENVRGAPLRNRHRLLRAMRRRGFAGYHREWWHFEHTAPRPRRMDLTLGCRK